MPTLNSCRTWICRMLACAAGIVMGTLTPACGQSDRPAPNATSTAQTASVARRADGHPLDQALKIAHSMRDHIERDVRDYTALLIKRERIKGELSDYQYMNVKIRNRVKEGEQVVRPFSVYLRFLKPRLAEGREVIWVEGRDENKIVAHEGGLKNLLTVRLDPEGTLAMMGQRYPIYDIGIQNLNDKLIEKGERDRAHDECEVKFFRNAKISDRACLMIEVRHPRPRPYFDFHVAQIFIDEELDIPVRYASYSWPKTPGGEPVLEEEYTYQNVKLNVGLEDHDFDPTNPEYRFP